MGYVGVWLFSTDSAYYSVGARQQQIRSIAFNTFNVTWQRVTF